MPPARLGSLALDCEDPRSLATFWAAMLGGELCYADEFHAAVRTERLWLTTVRITNHKPPVWPEGAVPKQLHLDLAVDDLDRAETEAVRLGARRVNRQPAPAQWRVLLDPAGHPFCLSTEIPAHDPVPSSDRLVL